MSFGRAPDLLVKVRQGRGSRVFVRSLRLTARTDRRLYLSSELSIRGHHRATHHDIATGLPAGDGSREVDLNSFEDRTGRAGG